MTNEEKKQFIIKVHRLFMKQRPYDNKKDTNEIKVKEDEFWIKYYSLFYNMLPQSLFKYRKCTKEAINNFENDTAWFSHPKDFDDTMDSTLNNDIEAELERFKENPSMITKELSKVLISGFSSSYGVQIDLTRVDEIFPLFNEDGTLNENKTKDYLLDKIPEYASDECVSRLKEITSKLINKQIKDAVYGFFNHYANMNDRIRKEVLTFSLAEECDNQAMWGLYADESKGFCIEYSFPKEDFLGQRMLLNLFPIYYGEKKLISFFDVLIRGLYSKNSINCISYDDYQEWFLSAHTKDKSYEFQREWRISFDKRFGANLQNFPFAKSIILGERISAENANRLIEIARKKKIDIYKRELNKTSSKIIIKRL